MDATLSTKSPLYDIQIAFQEFLQEYRMDTEVMIGLQSLIAAHPIVQNGSHFWRPVSQNGTEFIASNIARDHLPFILAWSRISNSDEVLCAVNLDHNRQQEVYVTIDKDLYVPDAKLRRLWGPETIPAELNVEDRNGKSVRLTLPPRTLVIYGNASKA